MHIPAIIPDESIEAHIRDASRRCFIRNITGLEDGICVHSIRFPNKKGIITMKYAGMMLLNATQLITIRPKNNIQ